jgi:type IV pilus assembly protein PilM
MLGLRRKSLVGLDIDTSAVRMVQLRRDGVESIVVRAGISNIAPWGGDPQLRKIHTIRAIRDGLARGDIRGKLAVCGLRGPEVVVRGFEFPVLPPEEIESAVQLEVSQICPFLAEESTLDYQVTSNRDRKTVGFWVAATNGLIANTRQMVTEAGLHCALVDVAGLALLNLLRCEHPEPRTDDRGQATEGGPLLQDAVLNLGDSWATIVIADPAGRPFVRDVGCGACAGGRPALAAARSGAEGSLCAEEDWAAHGSHRPATDNSLIEDVATTLRYYAAQNGVARVDRLLVCGGSANTEDLIESLREELDAEVEPWNPVAGMRCEAGPACESLLRESGHFLAVAAGLALRSV